MRLPTALCLALMLLADVGCVSHPGPPAAVIATEPAAVPAPRLDAAGCLGAEGYVFPSSERAQTVLPEGFTAWDVGDIQDGLPRTVDQAQWNFFPCVSFNASGVHLDAGDIFEIGVGARYQGGPFGVFELSILASTPELTAYLRSTGVPAELATFARMDLPTAAGGVGGYAWTISASDATYAFETYAIPNSHVFRTDTRVWAGPTPHATMKQAVLAEAFRGHSGEIRVSGGPMAPLLEPTTRGYTNTVFGAIEWRWNEPVP